MEPTNFGTGDNHLMDIARAIGRIEAMLSNVTGRQTDHEKRIGSLEEAALKVRTTITLVSFMASGVIGAGVLVIQHYWK
jgi:hypothetical protein